MQELYVKLSFLVVGCFCAMLFLQKILQKKASRQMYVAVRLPLIFSLFVFFLSWAFEILQDADFFTIPFSTIRVTRSCMILGTSLVFFTRLKKVYFARFAEFLLGHKIVLQAQSLDVLSNILSILVYLAGFFALLQIAGVDIAPFLTFGGLGIAAVGIAGKDMMANVFASFMLLITCPFRIGDSIELPDKKIAGKVQRIGWFTTILLNEKNHPIYVPNFLFSATSIINSSRERA